MYDYNEEDNEYFEEDNSVDYGKALRTINEMYEDFGYLDIYDKQGERIDILSQRETIATNVIGYLKSSKQKEIAGRAIDKVIDAFFKDKGKAHRSLDWDALGLGRALDRNLTGYTRISTKESWYEILSRPKGWETQSDSTNKIQEQKATPQDNSEELKDKIDTLEEELREEKRESKNTIKSLEKKLTESNKKMPIIPKNNKRKKALKTLCIFFDEIMPEDIKGKWMSLEKKYAIEIEAGRGMPKFLDKIFEELPNKLREIGLPEIGTWLRNQT